MTKSKLVRRRLKNGGRYIIKTRHLWDPVRATFFEDPPHFYILDQYVEYKDVMWILEADKPGAAVHSVDNFIYC